MLVVCAIIGILFALALPAIQRVRDVSLGNDCRNNLRQLALALRSYDTTHGALPPGMSHQFGKSEFPFMGWQARILPFMDQNELWHTTVNAYKTNRRFVLNPPHIGFSTVIRSYGCPSDGRVLHVSRNPEYRAAFTSYLGNEGTNQFFQDGLLFLDSRVRLGDVKDGLSSTLLVGERPPSADEYLGWWYGGWGQSQDGSADMVLGVREHNVYLRNGGKCPKGPYNFTAGKINNHCDAFHFWSLHFGGANFAMCDGSVHFLSYSADAILPALATRAGNEAVELP